MRIGILETGAVNPALVEEHGPYTPMFDRFLRSADPSIETFPVLVYDGEELPSPTAADGWMITGSAHGAYEDLPWKPAFEQFLRDAVAVGVPVGGICFGHQILAQALGGKVVKSEKGWGLGAHDYQVQNAPSWAAGLGEGFTNYAVHQDQVVELPPNAQVLASSEFCPNASLVYGDPEHPSAITVQPHPEFGPEFVEAIVDLRKGKSFSEEQGEQAKASLGATSATPAWAHIFAQFFRGAQKRRAA